MLWTLVFPCVSSLIDLRFRTLIRVEVIGVIWTRWLYRNDKVFNDKNYSLLQVIYRCTGYAPFVVTSSEGGESRPIYGDLYMIGGYSEGYFFPTWMVA
jgi:hypothetical protein